MFTKKIMAVAATTIVAMGLGSSVASASIDKSTGGAAVGPISAPSAGASLVSGSLRADCATGNFAANILTNSSTSLIEVTQLNFATCTDNIPLINFISAALVGTEQANVTSTGATTGQVAFTSTVSAIVTLNTGTCTYTSTINPVGTTNDTNNSVSVANVPVTRTAGSSLCPASASFSASYLPVRDNAGSLVVIN